jgi:hypothetical protein
MLGQARAEGMLAPTVSLNGSRWPYSVPTLYLRHCSSLRHVISYGWRRFAVRASWDAAKQRVL